MKKQKDFLFSRKEIEKENERLREENGELRKENKRLREKMFIFKKAWLDGIDRYEY